MRQFINIYLYFFKIYSPFCYAICQCVPSWWGQTWIRISVVVHLHSTRQTSPDKKATFMNRLCPPTSLVGPRDVMARHRRSNILGRSRQACRDGELSLAVYGSYSEISRLSCRNNCLNYCMRHSSSVFVSEPLLFLWSFALLWSYSMLTAKISWAQAKNGRRTVC